MKKKIIFGLIALLILILGSVGVLAYLKISQKPVGKVIFQDKAVFDVELAKTDKEKTKGLSGRESLEIEKGMLFIYSEPDKYSYWMKDTLVPLDIIWINASTSLSTGTVVDITTLDPQNDDNIPQYSPKEPANFVLEINAGLAENYNIQIGDEVEIKL